jgi:hypothetical protein
MAKRTVPLDAGDDDDDDDDDDDESDCCAGAVGVQAARTHAASSAVVPHVTLSLSEGRPRLAIRLSLGKIVAAPRLRSG